MKKKIKYILLLVIFAFFINGCTLFKRDSMEDITILTTIYANEYVLSYLYGDNAVINSIYPDDTNIDVYTFTDKQIRDNSKKDLFVYMGKTNDSNIAITYINKNKNLKLIDASFGMEYKNAEEELWLNPSNLLMIAQNIKNGLCEYIKSAYLTKEIETNYENLKIEISELDAEMHLSLSNAPNDTIFTNSKALKYLEKYGIDVIVVSENDPQYEKNLAILNNYIENKKVSNFYILENSKYTNDINKLVTDNKITLLTIRNLKNITDSERNNKTNYIDISKSNLDLLKKELY